MFDVKRNVIERVTEYSHVTVEEKRAPTDESVKLLKELEKEAQKKITDAIRVSDTHFECVVHRLIEPVACEAKWIAVFSINGKKMQAKFSQFQIHDDDIEKAVIGLRDAVADEIANLIGPAFIKSVGKFRVRNG